MQIGGIGTSIVCSDANVNIVWAVLVLCVLTKYVNSLSLHVSHHNTYFDEHVPVAVFIEDVRV
jgi:hypothetical protein